jgi:hypothetical protein
LEEARVFLKIQVLFLSGKELNHFLSSQSTKEEEAQIFQPSSSFQLLSQTLQTLTNRTINTCNTRAVVLSLIPHSGSSSSLLILRWTTTSPA